MKFQDIDTIVRLLREEASELSSKDYARIMMREAAHVIVALAAELAARDEQSRTRMPAAEERRIQNAMRDMNAAAHAAAEQWSAMLTAAGTICAAPAVEWVADSHKAAPVRTESQPECPVAPEDLYRNGQRAERERVLALVVQMRRVCSGLHSRMDGRIEALIEDIKCGARTYP